MSLNTTENGRFTRTDRCWRNWSAMAVLKKTPTASKKPKLTGKRTGIYRAKINKNFATSKKMLSFAEIGFCVNVRDLQK